jgi:hypothetical protein
MASADVIPKLPMSFVYEDLISKIQEIQSQVVEFENVLDDRCKNQRKLPDELKSHTLVFIDPYGNRTVNKYMDHESINRVIKKYKKDYVPRYLHQWIKIGTRNGDFISPLNDSELKSTISHYANGYQFITYGEINIWIEVDGYFRSKKLTLKTFLTDDMNKIITQIKNQRKVNHVELKYCTTDENAKPDQKVWDKGTILNLNDTIMSCRLYQDDCVIMAKLITENASYNIYSTDVTRFCLFFNRVPREMTIPAIKYSLKLLQQKLLL